MSLRLFVWPFQGVCALGYYVKHAVCMAFSVLVCGYFCQVSLRLFSTAQLHRLLCPEIWLDPEAVAASFFFVDNDQTHW